MLCLVAALGYDATARWAMRLLMLGDPGSAALILGRSRPSGDDRGKALEKSADGNYRYEGGVRWKKTDDWAG